MATYTNWLYQKGVTKRNFPTSDCEVNSWLANINKENKTAEELIAVIIFKIEAPPLYYKKVYEAFNHLKQIISFFYKNLNVKVELFGSAITKLALKDSDVDVYLDFKGNLPKPPEIFLRSLKNQVRKFGYFINSIPIFARVPIVHCVHRNRIECDLSFSSSMGVVNSNLIKFFLSIDDRLRPLILILKFLMKSQGLHKHLSSFGLISLIVFFLQNLEDPIIPAICYLQSFSPEKKMVENWNVSFSTEISHLPTVNNQLSVTELLQTFFEFYSTFEFGFYIISVFTAKKYLKPVFSDAALLPEEFQLYKANLVKDDSYKFECNKFMCVQNFFDHNSNITRNVSQNFVRLFQNLCFTNGAIGQDLLKENKSEENKVKYLMKLFDQKSNTPKKKRFKAEDVVIFVGDNVIFDNCNCTEDDLRNEWSKYIFNTVKNILCKVMKCDVKVQSSASGDDSSTLANDEKIINCEFHYIGLLTKKRNVMKSEVEIPQNVSAVRKEEIISDYLCNTELKGAKKAFLKFSVVCCVQKRPTCFSMTLESRESQKNRINFIQQIFQFIRNYFPKWIK